MNKEVRTIEIGETGRYIIEIDGLLTPEDVAVLREQFNEWWKSGEKFVVFNVPPDFEIEVHRLQDEVEGG